MNWKLSSILLLCVISFSAFPAKAFEDKRIVIFVTPANSLNNITPEMLNSSSNEAKFATFLRKTNLNYIYKSYSWQRGFRELLINSDMMAFGISRTPQREDKFIWVLPLYKIHFSLYGNRSADQSKWTRENLLAGKLKIACVELSNECEHLRSLKIPESAIIEFVSSDSIYHITLLKRQRVDFIFRDETLMQNNLDIVNAKLSEFQKSDLITTPFTEYLAANIDYDPKIISILRKAAHDQQFGLDSKELSNKPEKRLQPRK